MLFTADQIKTWNNKKENKKWNIIVVTDGRPCNEIESIENIKFPVPLSLYIVALGSHLDYDIKEYKRITHHFKGAFYSLLASEITIEEIKQTFYSLIMTHCKYCKSFYHFNLLISSI